MVRNMTVNVTVKRWGNSLGLIIPNEVIKGLGLKTGQEVDINILTKDEIDGFGMIKGAPSFTREKSDDFRYA